MVERSSGIASETRPLLVLTGFLGSGKTTIIRRLAARPDRRLAILVNEVGAIGIDQRLIERIDEDLLLLAGGCVCCALRDDLNRSLDRVLDREPDAIVLETTGLADPAPILHALAEDPGIARRLRLGGVAAVVDALRAEDLVAEQPEMLRQLDLADRIVLTKTDLAPPERVASLRERLGELAPGREIRAARDGVIDPGWLLRERLLAGASTGELRALIAAAPAECVARHLPFATHSLRHPEPVDIEALQLWLRLVAQIDGPRLLRIKALVRSADDGRCRLVQSAGRSVAPPLLLERDLPEVAGAEVVIIERGMPEPALAALLDSLRSALRER